MDYKLIRKNSTLICKSVVVTTPGIIRFGEIIVPGTSVKVVKKDVCSRCKCEVLPRSEKNGPVFVWLYPSELATKEACQTFVEENAARDNYKLSPQAK